MDGFRIQAINTASRTWSQAQNSAWTIKDWPSTALICAQLRCASQIWIKDILGYALPGVLRPDPCSVAARSPELQNMLTRSYPVFGGMCSSQPTLGTIAAADGQRPTSRSCSTRSAAFKGKLKSVLAIAFMYAIG